MKYLILAGSVTIFDKKDSWTIPSKNELYNLVCPLLKQEEWDKVTQILNYEKKLEKRGVSISGEDLLINGNKIRSAATDIVLKKEKMVSFLIEYSKNKNFSEKIYEAICEGDFLITRAGHLIAYILLDFDRIYNGKTHNDGDDIQDIQCLTYTQARNKKNNLNKLIEVSVDPSGIDLVSFKTEEGEEANKINARVAKVIGDVDEIDIADL